MFTIETLETVVAIVPMVWAVIPNVLKPAPEQPFGGRIRPGYCRWLPYLCWP